MNYVLTSELFFFFFFLDRLLAGQGGNHVDVFTAQGGSPGAGWKKEGDFKKEFHKVVRTFAFVLGSKILGGGNQRSTYVQFPEEDTSRSRTKSPVGLKQPFLLLQLLVPQEKGFAIELDVSDVAGVRRRLDFSTVAKRIVTTRDPPRVSFPLSELKRDTWLNVCVDVAGLLAFYFDDAEFQSVDKIVVRAPCSLHRVFTMRYRPQATTSHAADVDLALGIEDMDEVEAAEDEVGPTDEIPTKYILHPDAHAQTIVLSKRWFSSLSDSNFSSSGSSPNKRRVGGSGGHVSFKGAPQPAKVAGRVSGGGGGGNAKVDFVVGSVGSVGIVGSHLSPEKLASFTLDGCGTPSPAHVGSTCSSSSSSNKGSRQSNATLEVRSPPQGMYVYTATPRTPPMRSSRLGAKLRAKQGLATVATAGNVQHPHNSAASDAESDFLSGSATMEDFAKYHSTRLVQKPPNVEAKPVGIVAVDAAEMDQPKAALMAMHATIFGSETSGNDGDGAGDADTVSKSIEEADTALHSSGGLTGVLNLNGFSVATESFVDDECWRPGVSSGSEGVVQSTGSVANSDARVSSGGGPTCDAGDNGVSINTADAVTIAAEGAAVAGGMGDRREGRSIGSFGIASPDASGSSSGISSAPTAAAAGGVTGTTIAVTAAAVAATAEGGSTSPTLKIRSLPSAGFRVAGDDFVAGSDWWKPSTLVDDSFDMPTSGTIVPKKLLLPGTAPSADSLSGDGVPVESIRIAMAAEAATSSPLDGLLQLKSLAVRSPGTTPEDEADSGNAGGDAGARVSSALRLSGQVGPNDLNEGRNTPELKIDESNASNAVSNGSSTRPRIEPLWPAPGGQRSSFETPLSPTSPGSFATSPLSLSMSFGADDFRERMSPPISLLPAGASLAAGFTGAPATSSKPTDIADGVDSTSMAPSNSLGGSYRPQLDRSGGKFDASDGSNPMMSPSATELELVYDPVLNAYQDQHSGKWYQLDI